MKNIILSFLAFMLCASISSVQAQEMAAKTEATVEATKGKAKPSKRTLLKNIEDAILEENKDQKAVQLITAERDYVSLKKSYMNSKFGKPLAEMDKIERKENLETLKNDDEFINLRKQTDIAKIEKEEYLIAVNPEYAKIMADLEAVMERAQMANKNSPFKGGKAGLGRKMKKGSKKGVENKGISRKSLKK